MITIPDENDEFCYFKVKDYTTLLVGRYSDKFMTFYIQRGDGKVIAEYEAYRITHLKIIEIATKITYDKRIIKKN